jgi:hypothetical protein
MSQMAATVAPVYRVLIGTNNYAPGDSPEEAAQRALAGFLRHMPEGLRQNWRVLAVEMADPVADPVMQGLSGTTPSVTEGPKGSGRE